MQIVRAPFLLALLVCVSCASRGDYNTAQSRIDQQRVVIESQRGEIDNLKVDLTRARGERDRYKLEAERHETESSAYGEARRRLEKRIAGLESALGSTADDGDIRVTPLPEGGYQFTVADRVLFATGDDGLSEAGQAVLDKVASLIAKGSGPIEVVGHTDNVPIKRPETLKRFPRGNLELSAARALSVADYLIGKGGVAASRVSVSGHGEHHPVTDNDSDAARRKNRRVEIRVPDGD